jgi:biotin transport system ATP-binding protein
MIELNDISHRFGERRVLTGVNLVLGERRVGIIGSNGSGKSTLARLLNGLVLPSAGRVLVDGLDTSTDARAVRRKVGFVFQDPDLQIVCPTVEEDIAFGLKNQKLARHEIAPRVEAALARFGLMAHRHQPAHLLSGGEKQLLALAAVLVMTPAYVVFDEPTTLLDLRNAEAVGRIVASLRQQVILLTHHLSLLTDFDRVLVFDEGRIVGDAAPAAAIAEYRERMQ